MDGQNILPKLKITNVSKLTLWIRGVCRKEIVLDYGSTFEVKY